MNYKVVSNLSDCHKLPKVKIYTDGACSGNPGPGGYGIVMIFNGHKKELSGAYEDTTNNRMELIAAIKGLEALNRTCSVTLYSDSKYLVDAINKGWVTKWRKNNWMRTKTDHAKNVDLWKRLMELLEVHDVKFVWVKGHADNEFNNRCDELALEAIKKQGHMKK